MSESKKPMLIHVSPKIIQHAAHIDLELVDVSIPELDIVLQNNVEIVTRKPYPNRRQSMASSLKATSTLTTSKSLPDGRLMMKRLLPILPNSMSLIMTTT